MHPLRFRSSFLSLFAFAVLPLTSGCAAPTESAETETVGASEDELMVAQTTATCESGGGDIHFSLHRTSKYDLRYDLEDVVMGGETVTDKISGTRAKLKLAIWNGWPLDGRRIVTETRMSASFGEHKGFYDERIKCVAVLGDSPTFLERLRLQYEYMKGGVYEARHDPTVLTPLGKVDAKNLPPNLAARVEENRHNSGFRPYYALSFEGRTLYEHAQTVFTSSPPTSQYHTLYDEDGTPIAVGVFAAQDFRGVFMTNDQWDEVPRTGFRWGSVN